MLQDCVLLFVFSANSFVEGGEENQEERGRWRVNLSIFASFHAVQLRWLEYNLAQ